MAESTAVKKGTVTPISSLFPAEEAHKASKLVQETIAERQQQLEQLKGFMNENIDLINLVQKLPDELQHNIMVPFGKAAFFPGRLIHTNEFMVLLGVDHYVERTSKQTIDILKRRGKVLENQHESLKAVMQDLKAEASFFDTTASEAVDGLVEIREDYVDESPLEVVPLTRDTKSTKSVSFNFPEAESTKAANKEDEEYERILSRMTELELQEEEAEKADEINDDKQIGNDLYSSPSQSNATQEDRSTKVEASNLQLLSKDGSSHGKGPAPPKSILKNKVFEVPQVKEKFQAPATADHKVSRPSSITGSDTNTVEASGLQLLSKDGSSHGKGPTPPASSLKNKAFEVPQVKEKFQSPAMADHKVSRPSSIPGSDTNTAFTGSIVERAPEFRTNSAQPQSGSHSSRPVSKFKMQLQRK